MCRHPPSRPRRAAPRGYRNLSDRGITQHRSPEPAPPRHRIRGWVPPKGRHGDQGSPDTASGAGLAPFGHPCRARRKGPSAFPPGRLRPVSSTPRFARSSLCLWHARRASPLANRPQAASRTFRPCVVRPDTSRPSVAAPASRCGRGRLTSLPSPPSGRSLRPYAGSGKSPRPALPTPSNARRAEPPFTIYFLLRRASNPIAPKPRSASVAGSGDCGFRFQNMPIGTLGSSAVATSRLSYCGPWYSFSMVPR